MTTENTPTPEPTSGIEAGLDHIAAEAEASLSEEEPRPDLRALAAESQQLAEAHDAQANTPAPEPTPQPVDVAPYELVSDPQHQEIAAAYHAEVSDFVRSGAVDAPTAETVLHYVLGKHADEAIRDAAGAVEQGQQIGVRLNNPQTTMSYLYRVHGKEMGDAIIRDAQAAFRALPEATRNKLDRVLDAEGSTLTNSPYLLEALALVQNGWTRLSKSTAQEVIKKLSAKGSTLSPLDKTKLAFARHIASRGESSDAPSLRGKGNLIPPKQKKEIAASLEKALDPDMSREREIRNSPDYYTRDGNPKLHKALVDEMAEIHARRAARKGGR